MSYKMTICAIHVVFLTLIAPREAMQVSVESFIGSTCPGDIVSVLCDITNNNELQWRWESGSSMQQYSFIARMPTFSMIDQQLNFTEISFVTLTLLSLSLTPLMMRSSLHYTISDRVPTVTITCNPFIQPTQVVSIQTNDCLNVNANFTFEQDTAMESSNHANFRLAWIIDRNYNSTYYINVSINLEKVMTLSTIDSNVNISLEFEMEYNIFVYKFCCGTIQDIGNFNITLYRNNTYFIQGNISYTILMNQVFSGKSISLTTAASDREEEVDFVSNTSENTNSSCDRSGFLQPLLISVGSTLLFLFFSVNVIYLSIIVILKKRIESISKKLQHISVEEKCITETPLYEQVSDKPHHTTTMVDNSAYGYKN